MTNEKTKWLDRTLPVLDIEGAADGDGHDAQEQPTGRAEELVPS